MAHPVHLETFDAADFLSGRAGLSAAEAEELRLAAYEQGYTAGWEDAAAGLRTGETRLQFDVAHAIAELRLSHETARAEVLSAIEPVLREMTEKVLPVVAHAAIGGLILEQMRPFLENAASTPLRITCAPAALEAVRALLSTGPGLPAEVAAEESLSPGQAFLSGADRDLHINLDEVVTTISEAITAFFHSEREGTGP